MQSQVHYIQCNLSDTKDRCSLTLLKLHNKLKVCNLLVKELKTVVEAVKEDCQAQTEAQVRGWVLLTKIILPVVVQLANVVRGICVMVQRFCDLF